MLAGTVSTTVTFGTFTFTRPAAQHRGSPGRARLHDRRGATGHHATNGSYEFDDVAPGAYQVEFVDPNHTYKTQWYDATSTGAVDQSGAATVTLSAGKATTAVNASLVAGS